MRKLFLLFLLSAVALSADTKKILAYNMSAGVVKDFQSVSDEVEVIRVDDDTVMDHIAEAHGFIGNIKPEHVRAADNLEWVQTISAGVEQVLHMSGSDALKNSKAVLTNNQIVQGPEIADHAMAMLLTLTRRIPRFIEARKEENWDREDYDGIELRDKTALVIGVGGIGVQIAVRAHAHGMRVVGVDPEDIPFLPFVERAVKPDQLNEVIPEADVVFMAAPHTPKSHKMLGPKQFELMKEDSYFIAVSRGKTYDANALVKALDSEKLSGAGVDVTDPEPLPEGHALWEFDNVIITPHIAGRSDADRERMFGTVKTNIRRFAEGLPLVNVVDKQRGY